MATETTKTAGSEGAVPNLQTEESTKKASSEVEVVSSRAKKEENGSRHRGGGDQLMKLAASAIEQNPTYQQQAAASVRRERGCRGRRMRMGVKKRTQDSEVAVASLQTAKKAISE